MFSRSPRSPCSVGHQPLAAPSGCTCVWNWGAGRCRALHVPIQRGFWKEESWEWGRGPGPQRRPAPFSGPRGFLPGIWTAALADAVLSVCKEGLRPFFFQCWLSQVPRARDAI